MLPNAVSQPQASTVAQNGSPADATTVVPQAALVVTREEAELLLDGLHMVSNCRRYAFKEAHEDVRQMHGQLFDTIAHLERLIRENFGK